MLLSIEAEEKSGKSTLALTAPLPIVCFSFDLGTDRAINGTKYDEWFKGLNICKVPYNTEVSSAWEGNDITIYELPRPIQLDQELLVGFEELWNYFILLCSRALMDKAISTIVIDTMTLCRRIKCDAYLQELQEENIKKGQRPRKQLLQIEYGHPNDSIRNIYDLAVSLGKNLVATHHLTDEYKLFMKSDGSTESMPTGVRLLEGLTGTYRYQDVAVRNTKVKNAITTKLEICGYNLGLEGMIIPDPNWDKIAGLISDSLGGRVSIQRRNSNGAGT